MHTFIPRFVISFWNSHVNVPLISTRALIMHQWERNFRVKLWARKSLHSSKKIKFINQGWGEGKPWSSKVDRCHYQYSDSVWSGRSWKVWIMWKRRWPKNYDEFIGCDLCPNWYCKSFACCRADTDSQKWIDVKGMDFIWARCHSWV